MSDNVNSDTSTARGHWRLVALVAVLLGVLAVAAWALVAGPGPVPDPADAGPATSSPAVSSPAPSADDPPTAMPDGAPIPSPSPGTPETLGEGSTEAVEPVVVRPPVGLEETADFGTGVTVELSAIRSVQGVARSAGEVAGPALEVTVEAGNDSDAAVPLDGVVVFLSYGADRTPATDFGHGSAPLSGSLAPGARATGTYVFAVPEDQRGDVRVEISYTGEAPTVAFTGSLD